MEPLGGEPIPLQLPLYSTAAAERGLREALKAEPQRMIALAMVEAPWRG